MMKLDPGVKYGLIVGGIALAIFVIACLIDPVNIFNLLLWYGSLGIYIWGISKAATEEADIAFRKQLTYGFSVFVIANALFYAFYFLLFNYVNPELVEIQKTKMLESPYYTEEQLNDFNMGASIIFQNYASSLIGGFIIALITVYIVNRLALKPINNP